MPTVTTLTLNAAVTGTRGWTCGQPFRKGDLPAGQTLQGLQLNIKNYWPDGSVKFGIVSGQTELTASTPVAVALQTGVAASGSALTIADLKSTGITASFGAGIFGAAEFAGTDFDTPHNTWVSGPLMSAWTYRKQIGADAHLVAWIEVRLYAGGAVEVLPWVENCYVMVAGSTNKSETYTFTLGGTQRFSAAIDLLNHTRTPLISGSELRYWLGTDGLVSVSHDRAYFSSTKLVPAYRITVPDSHASVTALPTTFSPLAQGNFPAGMGAAGYHKSIGVLPAWDAVYLSNSTSPIPWSAIQRQGYSAGRYGTHWRDEATNQPVRFSSYPNRCIGYNSGIGDSGNHNGGGFFVQPTGPQPPWWKGSHHPSVGYLAYLVTGSHYHLETLQFVAITSGFKAPEAARQAGKFILWTDDEQVRGAAWQLRTMAQAASASPDGSIHRGEFTYVLEQNVEAYHTRYVAAPGNPLGYVRGYAGGSYSGNTPPAVQPSWMHDFLSAALGYWKCLEIPLASTTAAKFEAFYTYQAETVLNRFGGTAADEYLYRDAGVYVLAVAPNNSVYGPNYPSPLNNGPWYANWGEVWEASHDGGVVNSAASGIQPARTKEIGDGTLRGGYWPSASGYWGNMLPALTYAVSNGLPGAQAAYNLITSAPNWGDFEDTVAASIEWGTAPHAAAAPAPTAQGSTVRVDSAPLISGAVVFGTAGHGVLGSAVPTTGDDGGSLIDLYLTRPYDNDVEVRWRVTGVSAGVTIRSDENGAATVTVPSDGTHWIDYEIYKAGVLFTSDRANFIVGANTGAMAATESGSDTASAAGYRSAFGLMAATESGADTAAIAGGVVNSGELSANEVGSDTASIFAAEATNSGQMSATEIGSDTAQVLGGFPFSKVVVTRRVVIDPPVARVSIPAE